MPGTITANYLASVLDMGEKSAQNNIQPSLRLLGIVDEDDKPTDLAVKWRDDVQYPDVCKEVCKKTYPSELIDIGPDREAVQRWFANHTGSGINAVGKMTAVFMLLADAKPQSAPSGAKKATTKKVARKATPKKKATRTEPQEKKAELKSSGGQSGLGVPLHINVQVHISSDSTPDQIDQIFASMAKHLHSNE